MHIKLGFVVLERGVILVRSKRSQLHHQCPPRQASYSCKSNASFSFVCSVRNQPVIIYHLGGGGQGRVLEITLFLGEQNGGNS